jgi:hypothetical protein
MAQNAPTVLLVHHGIISIFPNFKPPSFLPHFFIFSMILFHFGWQPQKWRTAAPQINAFHIIHHLKGTISDTILERVDRLMLKTGDAKSNAAASASEVEEQAAAAAAASVLEDTEGPEFSFLR